MVERNSDYTDYLFALESTVVGTNTTGISRCDQCCYLFLHIHIFTYLYLLILYFCCYVAVEEESLRTLLLCTCTIRRNKRDSGSD